MKEGSGISHELIWNVVAGLIIATVVLLTVTVIGVLADNHDCYVYVHDGHGGGRTLYCGPDSTN